MVLVFYKLHEILGPKVKNNLYARENWDNHAVQLHAAIGSQLTEFHCFLDLLHDHLKKPEKIWMDIIIGAVLGNHKMWHE